jgi:mono/diheme cytochrome c family protein
MRTNLFKYQRKWEFALRSDKSFLTYSLVGVILFFGGFSLLLGTVRNGNGKASVQAAAPLSSWTAQGRLSGLPLYVSQCARCHGLDGQGDGPGANSPTFAAVPRDLTLGKFAFLSTDNGVASDDDLARTVRAGLVPAGMPGFGELDDAQIASLVSLVRSFAKTPPDKPGQVVKVPSCPPQAAPQQGRDLFVHACAPCHGEHGRGDGPNVSSLRDFSDRPLRPRDLTKPSAYKVGTDPEQIYLRIAAGTPPVMPGFKETYSPEQIWSIVKFLQAEFLSGKRLPELAAAKPKPAATSPGANAGANQYE